MKKNLPKWVTKSRYSERATMFVPSRNEKTANDYLERQGLGRCFSIACVAGNAPAGDAPIKSWACSMNMTPAIAGILQRLVEKHGGKTHSGKSLGEAMAVEDLKQKGK